MGKTRWDHAAVDREMRKPSSVGTIERELSPLPPLAPNRGEPRVRVETDSELAEFVEFFTVTRPDLASIRPGLSQPAPRRSRLARATERVGRLAAARPEIRLPGRSRRPSRSAPLVDGFVVEADAAPRARRLKLPPVWILTNLAILLAMVVGFWPQIITMSAESGCTWYTVRSGDTLWKISERYGKTIRGIATANHIQNINMIYVDQRLCIPMTPFAASATAYTPASSRPPSSVSPSNVSAFINFTLPYARQTSRQTGWPVSMILAQWGLETGWRVHTFTGYNWGNCGAMPGQPMVGGTSAPGSPAAFAYAYTPQQGIAEYTHVATLSYYTSVAPAARAGGADAAARALGRSPWDWGHYTNHGSPGSSLITIMRSFNLYWYDTH